MRNSPGTPGLLLNLSHRSATALRRFALVIATIAGAACGKAKDEASVQAVRCGAELEALREEMEWADATIAQPRPLDLAGVPEWRHTTVPDRVLELRSGTIEIDEKVVAALPDLAGRVESIIAAYPGSDPNEVAHDAERNLDLELARALKAALASSGQAPVALAIVPGEPWQTVRPTLKALSKQVGTVRLLVGMPPPAWWDKSLFDEVVEGTNGLGMVAHRLSLRAAEVFADCPGAAALAAELPGEMVAWVDGLEACSCSADMATSRALLHAIATPLIAPVGAVELTVVTDGDGIPFEADTNAPWSDVLPRLLAAPAPVLLPDPPAPKDAPPPAPPP